MSELLKKNLNNIQTERDIFGNEIKKLSMRDRIGFLPISIWEPDWGIVKQLKEIIGDFAQERELVDGSVNKKNGRKWNWEATKDKPHPEGSIFNPHLAQMILSAYCPPKAEILDLFGGGGTRGFIALAMGHNYKGVELRQSEVDRIKVQMAKLGQCFEIVCSDSRKVELRPNSYDFHYTCPPYYNLEIYSKDKNDLSNASSYPDFLKMLEKIILRSRFSLKPGTLSVWVVGNFRNSLGSLVDFRGDVVKLHEINGFKFWDDIIWHGASGNAVQRCGNFEANRKSVRVHEHILVFKKYDLHGDKGEQTNEIHSSGVGET